MLDDLIHKLRDEKTRWEAILNLKMSTDKTWAEKIVPHLSDKDWVVRWAVAEKLGDMGYDKAAPKLLELLSDHDFHVRKNSFNALKKLGVKIVPHALAYLKCQDKRVRDQVVSLFLECGAEMIPVIKKQVPKQDWIVGTRLINIMWQLGGDTIEDDLIDLITERLVQKHIIVRVGQMKSLVAIPNLIRLYKKPSLKRIIIASFNNMGSKESYPKVIRALQNSALKKEATEIILKIKQPMVHFLVSELIKEDTNDANLIELIGTIGLDEPIHKKINSLSDKYPKLKKLL